MREHTELSEKEFLDFLSLHQLPAVFRATAEKHFLPLAVKLPDLKRQTGPLFIGINGAQGTGKSTLADYLRLATASLFNWNVAVLSIDDFYFTRAERVALGREVHPLLATRGVPGTHDIEMLERCLHQLRSAEDQDFVPLPRFDKSTDDRAETSTWPVAQGPLDLILLEGWCVGSHTQPDAMLNEPVNTLERDEDTEGVWRRYANDQLRACYEPLFLQLDAMVFLKAPSFDAILRWRLEQEEKLAAKSDANSARLMNKDQLIRFIQHYERITRTNMEALSRSAQVLFEIDEAHSVVKSTFRLPS